jgi:hypothetical protein
MTYCFQPGDRVRVKYNNDSSAADHPAGSIRIVDKSETTRSGLTTFRGNYHYGIWAEKLELCVPTAREKIERMLHE